MKNNLDRIVMLQYRKLGEDLSKEKIPLDEYLQKRTIVLMQKENCLKFLKR